MLDEKEKDTFKTKDVNKEGPILESPNPTSTGGSPRSDLIDGEIVKVAITYVLEDLSDLYTEQEKVCNELLSVQNQLLGVRDHLSSLYERLKDIHQKIRKKDTTLNLLSFDTITSGPKEEIANFIVMMRDKNL